MKDFFKQVLAVIVGFVLVSVFFSVMSFVMLIAMVAAGSSKPALSEGSVLHLNLNGNIEERATEDPFSTFMGSPVLSTQGLDDVLKAIKVAKTNKNIAGIYVEGGVANTDFATLEEIRKALQDFKKSGKFVLAYGETYTQGAYYVASAADSVFINPSGMLEWRGIASAPMFYKELLEKVGVKMQVFRVGTFKSAVEPFTRTDMSEANRAQVKSFISDIWDGICREVSVSRKVSADSLNLYADNYVALSDAEDFVAMKLVDRTAYIDQVRASLRRLAGQDKVKLVSPSELAQLEELPEKSDGEVAVYYAYGDIVGAEATGSFGGGSQIVGPQVVEDLDKLMNDDNIKAVVVRINSGGGSAYASEQIWRAVTLLKQKKPVVVSMGGMAASGGYYMACAADYIVAEPSTLTGSIGIFGLVPDASGLLTDKLGLHFDVVKTNEASDFGAMGRGFNAAESGAMQAHVERGYALFLKRVADGRKMKTDEVDLIAQGRVWTGRQALDIKLVDKLGTLDDAVAEAVKRAKLKNYTVVAEPAPADWMDELLNSYKSGYMESRLSAMLGEYYRPLQFVYSLEGKDRLQARIPFEPNLH